MRYDYNCKQCGAMFDVSMPVSEYAKVVVVICPSCKSSQTRRSFVNVPVIAYRGQGFTLKVEEETPNDNDDVSAI